MALQPYFLSATAALLLSLYLYNRHSRNDRAASPSHDADSKRRRRSQDLPPGMAREPDGSFRCTAGSVAAARAMLMARGGLPPELADMILERAEYWPVERAATERELTVAPRPSLSAVRAVDPAACLYLQTGPLGRGTGSGLAAEPFARCRRVVVRIVARDQGWASGGDARPGTYQGAFSWFEASIARPVAVEEATTAAAADERRPAAPVPPSPHDGEPLSPLVTLMAGPFGAEHGNQNLVNWANFYLTTEPSAETRALARGGWRLVENEANGDGAVTWLVQRNKVAHREFLEHTVDWRDDEPAGADDDDDDDDDAWPEDGRGKGRGFVAALERGDRILIWARAMYPGWTNTVQSVTIEAYFSV